VFTHARILDGEGDCELVRAIARTVSKTFWVPLYEPRDVDRYETLGEIIKDLQLERGDPCEYSYHSTKMMYFLAKTHGS
jgi:hypothetical protein